MTPLQCHWVELNKADGTPDHQCPRKAVVALGVSLEGKRSALLLCVEHATALAKSLGLPAPPVAAARRSWN